MAKVMWGIKNVYYSVYSNGTYATPVALNGAVSINLEAQGDINNFYADDTVYWKSVANNGYEGDLELALIPDDFRKDVLGEVVDDNGLIVENSTATPAQFALLFEHTLDSGTPIRIALYNCIATRPAVASNTKEDAIEPHTQTITISATANDDGYVKAFAESTYANFSQWFTTVQLPEFT